MKRSYKNSTTPKAHAKINIAILKLLNPREEAGKSHVTFYRKLPAVLAQAGVASSSCPTPSHPGADHSGQLPEYPLHHCCSSFFLGHVFNVETRAPFLSPGFTQTLTTPASAPPPLSSGIKPCTVGIGFSSVHLSSNTFSSFSIFLGNRIFSHCETGVRHCTCSVWKHRPFNSAEER